MTEENLKQDLSKNMNKMRVCQKLKNALNINQNSQL